MKMSVARIVAIVCFGLGSALFAASSNATLIGVDGSSGVGSLGLTNSGGTLAGPITLTLSNPFTSCTGNTGDLAPAGCILFLTPNPLVFNIGVGSITLADFAITGPATFGSFVPTSYSIVSQSANFLNIFLTGNFIPGTSVGTQAGGCATGGNTCDTTFSSLRWTFNQSGDSVTGAGTFNSPASGVPEPATLALLGVGLAGLAFVRRKR